MNGDCLGRCRPDMQNKKQQKQRHALSIPDDEWEQELAIKLREKNYIAVFDDHIDFDEATHKYYLDGVELDGSSTGFIHSFFGHFDADEVIKKMRKSRNWTPQNKYYGLSDQQIKDGWEKNRVQASTLGTRMHLILEWFYNDLVSEEQLRHAAEVDNMPELLQFLRFHHNEVVPKRWQPFRTELRAFSRVHRLAGSVDMLFRDVDGALIIVDWKRSKEIKRDNRWQKGSAPLEHLDDCNFSHYSLQLNLYKWFLERYTDYKVKGLYLGVFHPDQSDYQFLAAPSMQYEITAMLDHRFEEQRRARAQLLEEVYRRLCKFQTLYRDACDLPQLLDQSVQSVARLIVAERNKGDATRDEKEASRLPTGEPDPDNNHDDDLVFFE